MKSFSNWSWLSVVKPTWISSAFVETGYVVTWHQQTAEHRPVKSKFCALNQKDLYCFCCFVTSIFEHPHEMICCLFVTLQFRFAIPLQLSVQSANMPWKTPFCNPANACSTALNPTKHPVHHVHLCDSLSLSVLLWGLGDGEGWDTKLVQISRRKRVRESGVVAQCWTGLKARTGW